MDKQKISDQHYTHLALDVYNSAKQAVKKRGRRLSWLHFARPTATGWSFFRKKSVPWEVIQEVHQQVQNLHKACCSQSRVTDTFSEIINLSETRLKMLALH